jgi:hypothetical protein
MTSSHSAAAIFSSALQPSDHPTAEQVWAAVGDSRRRNGGIDGCAAECAAECGDHPETARGRVQWAIALTVGRPRWTRAAA